MEDLAGLNFSSNSQSKSTLPNQTRFPQNPTYVSPIPSRGFSPNYTIAPTRTNGGTTPRSAATSKQDSFAALSAFSGISRPAQSSNASLEQQRIAKEKERKEALEKEKRNLDMHFGADEFWEKHSRQGTPSITMTDTYCPVFKDY